MKAEVGQTPEAFAALSGWAVLGNLVPVTLGNLIGGIPVDPGHCAMARLMNEDGCHIGCGKDEPAGSRRSNA